MVRQICLAAALIAASIGSVSLRVAAQSARTFYIDYASGSNSNNGTSESTPWKTHPFMSHGSSCDSGGPTYTHQAGDNFIFKGGDTWPAACFGMNITAGGTSSAQDYYGTCGGQSTAPSACGGATWPSSGWVKPLFNMAGTSPSSSCGDSIPICVAATLGYITLDDFEMKGQLIPDSPAYPGGCGIMFGPNAPSNLGYAVGTIVENAYIHAWQITANVTETPYPAINLCSGGISGVQTLQWSEISGDDALSAGQQIPFGGGCWECVVVAYNKIHGGWLGCGFDYPETPIGVCHDNDFYHIEQNETSAGYHSHIIYDNSSQPENSETVYNNAVHDSDAGLNISTNAGAWIFNNVMWNLANNAAIVVECGGKQASCGETSYVFNNTIDMTSGGSGEPCFYSEESTIGTLYLQDNICIGGIGGIAATTLYQNNNYNMSTTEAAQYGFTAANRYSPSLADPNVENGTNLRSFCSGNLSQLCFDTSGAPWFGGSYKSRPAGTTSWTSGAFVFGANASQSNSKPTAPTNLTASVE
jgi:hypothetical protein